ncbi:MAG: hypothetical protein GXP16_18965 [Gammaproteobacteria bacterium]|nr:hypothetical protein [Gammaproteobacteria bacterium]
MKVVASTDEYTVYQRRDGRHAVQGANKRPINGDDKVKILLQHKLIDVAAPKAPETAPVETAQADTAEGQEQTEEKEEKAE